MKIKYIRIIQNGERRITLISEDGKNWEMPYDGDDCDLTLVLANVIDMDQSSKNLNDYRLGKYF